MNEPPLTEAEIVDRLKNMAWNAAISELVRNTIAEVDQQRLDEAAMSKFYDTLKQKIGESIDGTKLRVD